MSSIVNVNARELEEQGFDPYRVHLNHFNGRLYSGVQGWFVHQLNHMVAIAECVARFFHAIWNSLALFGGNFPPALPFHSKVDVIEAALTDRLIHGAGNHSLKLSSKILEFFQNKVAHWTAPNGLTILEEGIHSRSFEIESTDRGHKLGKALHLAVLRNLPRLAEHCISQGCPIQEKMHVNMRAFTNRAAMEAFSVIDQSDHGDDFIRIRPIFTAVLRDNAAMVNRLLDAGAQVDVADAFGNTLLEYLVVSGMERPAIRAIDLGAPVDQLAGTNRSIEERLPEQGMEDLRVRIEEARGLGVKG